MFFGKQALAIFLFQSRRVFQELTDLVPDGLVNQIGSQLLVPTQAHATETVGIRADAAIIRVAAWISFPRTGANRFPIESIPATGTDKQALQQIASPSLSNPGSLLVFSQLLLYRFKQGLVNQRRDRDAHPFSAGNIL